MRHYGHGLVADIAQPPIISEMIFTRNRSARPAGSRRRPGVSSVDSLANGALVIARFLLVTGIRPVGRKSHNGPGAVTDSEPEAQCLFSGLCPCVHCI